MTYSVTFADPKGKTWIATAIAATPQEAIEMVRVAHSWGKDFNASEGALSTIFDPS